MTGSKDLKYPSDSSGKESLQKKESKSFDSSQYNKVIKIADTFETILKMYSNLHDPDKKHLADKKHSAIAKKFFSKYPQLTPQEGYPDPYFEETINIIRKKRLLYKDLDSENLTPDRKNEKMFTGIVFARLEAAVEQLKKNKNIKNISPGVINIFEQLLLRDLDDDTLLNLAHLAHLINVIYNPEFIISQTIEKVKEYNKILAKLKSPPFSEKYRQFFQELVSFNLLTLKKVEKKEPKAADIFKPILAIYVHIHNSRDSIFKFENNADLWKFFNNYRDQIIPQGKTIVFSDHPLILGGGPQDLYPDETLDVAFDRDFTYRKFSSVNKKSAESMFTALAFARLSASINQLEKNKNIPQTVIRKIGLLLLKIRDPKDCLTLASFATLINKIFDPEMLNYLKENIEKYDELLNELKVTEFFKKDADFFIQLRSHKNVELIKLDKILIDNPVDIHQVITQIAHVKGRVPHAGFGHKKEFLDQISAQIYELQKRGGQQEKLENLCKVYISFRKLDLSKLDALNEFIKDMEEMLPIFDKFYSRFGEKYGKSGAWVHQLFYNTGYRETMKTISNTGILVRNLIKFINNALECNPLAPYKP